MIKEDRRESPYVPKALKCPICESRLNWIKNDSAVECSSKWCNYRGPVRPTVARKDMSLLFTKLRNMGHRWNGYQY